MYFINYHQAAFTLIEMLVVVTIVAMLATTSLWLFRLQVAKGRDSQRKDHLMKLKTVLEDYYADHDRYPASLPSCGNAFLPYLEAVPCDPRGENYAYETDGQSFKIFAKLENEKDPSISEVGCQGGCGPGGAYNWGVSSSNTRPGTP